MKYLLSLFFIGSLFAQVDSMRVTWTDPIDSDLDSVRIYADTVSTGATTYITSINEGVEEYNWKPSYGGHYHVRLKAVDDSSNVSAYSLGDTVTIWRDSIPSQFTFYDSTGAAVSSQIITRSGVVLSGFDSAQVTVTGGDYRLGVLSAWTRSPSFASTGDTLWAVDTSSASGLTKTDVILTIAGIIDTFSVTTGSAIATALLDSLKAYWILSDTTDSHSTNELTDVGTVLYAAGKKGNGIDIEREADPIEYFMIADNAALSMADNDFTIGAWIKIEEFAQAQNGIVCKNSGSTAWGYALYTNQADSTIRFSISSDGAATGLHTVNSAAGYTITTWYYILAWNNSTTDSIYIQINDGTIYKAAHAGGAYNEASELQIGHWEYASVRFDGIIDEASIWKRVLTAEERTYLYNSGNGRTYTGSAIE